MMIPGMDMQGDYDAKQGGDLITTAGSGFSRPRISLVIE
jgi:hypothetical protein